jgi:hypothetical protein
MQCWLRAYVYRRQSRLMDLGFLSKCHEESNEVIPHKSLPYLFSPTLTESVDLHSHTQCNAEGRFSDLPEY